MQYTVTHGEKGKIEVKVDVDKAEFAKAYDEMLDVLGKDTKVEGFRPGNVPRDILEVKIGTNKILNEAASFLASKHLSEIFKKENISPLGNPAIAVSTLAKDSPFSFTASIISKPKVKLGNWKAIKVKRIAAKEVGEKDVEESIKNIYEAWVKKSKVESQKSKVEENEEEKEDSSKKFIYDARGEKIFIKDEESPSFASSSAKASDDKQASEGKKDQIDDEFAKAIGARDLAHLREIVKKDLGQIVGDQVEAKLEEELFDEILKILEVEVPDILIDDEVNRMMVRINQTLEQQDRKLEDYLREQGTTIDALRAKWREQAEKNVKVTLAMDEIGRAENVKVLPEEIDESLKSVDQTKLTEEQKVDLKNYAGVSLFQAKTLDLVKKAVAA